MTFVQQRIPKAARAPYVDHWWHPRIWHGYTLGAWLRMLAANRFRVGIHRWPAAVIITACGVMHSTLGVIQALVYCRELRKGLRQAPVFIVGHWRCGTTLLHELLSADPRHCYPTTYQCFVPSHFLITQGFLPRWTRFLLPSRRPMDTVAFGWERPQEDEFALCALGEPSPYWVFAFPNERPPLEYLDLQGLPESARRRWQRRLSMFLAAVARDGRRPVLKSPTHTARVALLRQMFPEARFIHLVRHPFPLFASAVNMFRRMAEVEGLQRLRSVEHLEELVLQMCPRMYRAFHAQAAQVPENRLIHLRFEDLVEEPLLHLRRIYDQLELGPFEEALPYVEQYLASVRDHRRGSYDLTPEQKERVLRRWGFYFDRYGYSPEDPVC